MLRKDKGQRLNAAGHFVRSRWLSVSNGKVELRLTESQHDIEGLGVDDQTPIDGATSAKHPPASATASACPHQPIGAPDMELSITPTAGAPRYSQSGSYIRTEPNSQTIKFNIDINCPIGGMTPPSTHLHLECPNATTS